MAFFVRFSSTHRNNDGIKGMTNSPSGSNLSLAIGTAYAPGSTFKTAQALVMLSEGFISPEQVNDCNGGFTDGNIHVGCHKHATPLALADALAFSCNTWFLSNFMALLNDDFLYADPSEAITVWHKYMTSMGLGGPLGVDLTGERGGLVANAAYLNRRYKQGWDARTILWAGMGQGDITMQSGRHHSQPRLFLHAPYPSGHGIEAFGCAVQAS